MMKTTSFSPGYLGWGLFALTLAAFPFVTGTAPARTVGIAPFEDIGAITTMILRSDSLQKDLAHHLQSEHAISPVLLRPTTRTVNVLPDPNTQLAPPDWRSGGWRKNFLQNENSDWLDLGRRQGVEVVVKGTFEQFGPELRFFAEGLEPLTGDSLFTVRVEGVTAEKFNLTSLLADRIASQLKIREFGEATPPEGIVTPARSVPPVPPSDSGDSTTADDHYEAGFALTRRYDETKDTKLLEGAAQEYRAALSKDPEHFRALNNLGTVLHRLGRYEEAIEFYDRVLAINPTYVRAMENSALAYRSLGQNEEAIAMWRKSLLYEDREIIRKAIEETLEKLESGGTEEQTSP